MSRFVNVWGKRINMDTVAQYWHTPNDTIYIEFTNGVVAPGPMTLEEVALWLDDLDKAQQKGE